MIGTDRLQLVVDDQALPRDPTFYAPDGWWPPSTASRAAARSSSRNGDIDLTHPTPALS